MSTKYTKGPWAADENCANATDIKGPEGETICCVMNAAQEDLTEEDDANARLIATAPELLEFIRQVGAGGYAGCLPESKIVHVAKTLTAKATGGKE